MLTYYQAIIFGLTQGITELFPISSLGHSVLLPSVLGWHIDQNNTFFLTFLVATHSATALVLFLFFWKDWKKIIVGFINQKDSKLGWLLIIGTVPAGLLGFILQHPLQKLFANPQLVAGILILNGLMLLGAEQLRKKNLEIKQSNITRLQALKIGLLQCIALIPGFSRTGATITGGLLVGLNHEDGARFAFLLATPIIAAASILKLPELFSSQETPILGPTLIGAIFAGIGAYFSVKFLSKYFQSKNLAPFAIYCMLVGVIAYLII